MAKKLIKTNLSKSSTILHLLGSVKGGVKHSQLRNICFNVSSDGRIEWDKFKKESPNRSPQGFYQTWITDQVYRGLIVKDAKTKKYSLSKLGKLNILKPNVCLDNLKRTPKQEIEYLKNRIEHLKSNRDFYRNKYWNFYDRNCELTRELKELKNLFSAHSEIIDVLI